MRSRVKHEDLKAVQDEGSCDEGKDSDPGSKMFIIK